MRSLFALCLPSLLLAQPVSTAQNAQVWAQFEGNHPFVEGRPWGLFIELMNKSDHMVTSEAALFARLGLNFQRGNGDRITGGYAIQYNFPYDRASQPYRWVDHRIWEQYNIRRSWGSTPGNQWSLRFRLEQRWLQRKAEPDYTTTSEYKFEQTFRFTVRYHWRFRPKTYLILYDEVFLRAPPPEAEKIADQNRVFAGIGRILTEDGGWKIEAGYQYQATFNSADNIPGRERINHCLRITVSAERPFRRVK